MEEPGGLQSTGSLRVGHEWVTSVSLFTFIHSRRKWQPTPVFLPGESQGRGGLLGCRLWGRTESDMTEATQQQQQQQQRLICYEVNQVCWSFSQSVHLILPTYSPTLSKKKKIQQNHQISYLVFAKPWSQFCFCFCFFLTCLCHHFGVSLTISTSILYKGKWLTSYQILLSFLQGYQPWAHFGDIFRTVRSNWFWIQNKRITTCDPIGMCFMVSLTMVNFSEGQSFINTISSFQCLFIVLSNPTFALLMDTLQRKLKMIH